MTSFRYSDPLRPVSALTIGSSTYFVDGTPEMLAPLLERRGVAYDSLEPSKLNPHNGLIAIWKIGKLVDKLSGVE